MSKVPLVDTAFVAEAGGNNCGPENERDLWFGLALDAIISGVRKMKTHTSVAVAIPNRCYLKICRMLLAGATHNLETPTAFVRPIEYDIAKKKTLSPWLDILRV